MLSVLKNAGYLSNHIIKPISNAIDMFLVSSDFTFYSLSLKFQHLPVIKIQSVKTVALT